MHAHHARQGRDSEGRRVLSGELGKDGELVMRDVVEEGFDDLELDTNKRMQRDAWPPDQLTPLPWLEHEGRAPTKMTIYNLHLTHGRWHRVLAEGTNGVGSASVPTRSSAARGPPRL